MQMEVVETEASDARGGRSANDRRLIDNKPYCYPVSTNIDARIYSISLLAISSATNSACNLARDQYVHSLSTSS